VATLLAIAGAGVAVADHPFARHPEAPKLLDVDMDQLAGSRPLVAVGWLRWLEAAALAEADSLQTS
jgi:hypothetical protein